MYLDHDTEILTYNGYQSEFQEDHSWTLSRLIIRSRQTSPLPGQLQQAVCGTLLFI